MSWTSSKTFDLGGGNFLMAFEELLVVVAFGPLGLTLSSPPPVALRKNEADCFSSEAGAPSEKKSYQNTFNNTQKTLTLTDMKLTEYMGFTEKSATTEPFI